MSNFYISSDLALVTTVSLYYPIASVDKQNPGKVVFSFEETTSLKEFISKYYERKIKVEPRQYFDNLKALKGRIYSRE